MLRREYIIVSPYIDLHIFLYLQDTEDSVKKNILLNILKLIYFLDQGRIQKLIRHNRCLFNLDSKYKVRNSVPADYTRMFSNTSTWTCQVYILRSIFFTFCRLQSYIFLNNFFFVLTVQSRFTVSFLRRSGDWSQLRYETSESN